MAVNITRFQRLPGNPRGPHMDQTWWEADVESQSSFYTIHLWVDGGRSTDDDWAHGELVKLTQMHHAGALYGYSPFELAPDRPASPVAGGRVPRP